MLPVADTHTLMRELEMSERRRLTLKRQIVMDSLEPEDSSLWTMLDLITLLLVFFIVLYNNNLSRPGFKGLSHARTAQQNVQQKMTKPLAPQPSVTSAATRPLMEIETDPRLSRIRTRLNRLMLNSRLSDFRTILETDRVTLVIGESISFGSGRAELLSPVKPVLASLAGLLNEERGVRILVAGHTDNTPIHTQQFPSNWELSLARALGVGKYLMASGVDPARVGIQGFGQFRPVAGTGNPVSRSENRRVEISLVLN